MKLHILIKKESKSLGKTKKKLADLPTYSWDVDPMLSDKIDEVVYGNDS